MKKAQRLLAVVLTIFIILSFNGISINVHASRDSISAAEVVNYMNSLVDQPNNYQGYCLLFVTRCWVDMGFQSSSWGTAKNCADHNTVSTSKDDIPLGADVFFYDPNYPNGHIGIYVGDGYFVHAGNKSVYEKSSLFSNSYYSRYYTGWGWHPYVTVTQAPSVPTGSEMTSGYDRVLPDGDYIIASAGTSDKSSYYYLDIQGSDYPAAVETNVHLWGPLTDITARDVWTISYSDGFYSIKQKGTNRALDVYDASKAQGANVQVYQGNSTSAQKWAISKNGRNGYRIQAKCSGMSLDVNGGAITAGTNIQQWTNNDTDAQSWLFIPYKPTQPIDNGVYRINTVLNSSLYLSPESNSKNAKAIIRDYNAGNELFTFTKLDNGYYKILNFDTGFALGVKNGSSTVSLGIGLYADNGSIAEQWAIRKESGGYVIISRCNGLVLDVKNSNATSGTEVIQFYYHGGNNQLWQFSALKYTLTYNANGGEFYSPGLAHWVISTTQQKYEFFYGESVKIESYLPNNNTSGLVMVVGGGPYIKKNGYKLTGWSLTGGKNTVDYIIGNSYNFSKDTVLYAVWLRKGDINNDGLLNNKDLTRLFQYLSDWKVAVYSAALDVNGDGKINNKDLTRLFQYLSEWDVEIF